MNTSDVTELLPLSPTISVWEAIAIAVGYVALSFLLGFLGLYDVPGMIEWSPPLIALGLVWLVTRLKTNISVLSAFEVDIRNDRSRTMLWKGFKYAFFLIGFQLALISVIAICFTGTGHAAPEEPAYKQLLSWKTNGDFLVKLVQIGLLAPICEELLARGLLFAGLRKRMGFMGANLISSALFGLGHIYPIHILAAFSLGVLLCRLAEKTKSLLPGLVCHVMLNSFVMGALFLISVVSPTDVPKDKHSNVVQSNLSKSGR